MTALARASLQISDFDFVLPPERIAQTPLTPRDHSRLMVLDRANGSIAHRQFHELGESLRAGDVLVLNATRVFPARLRGKKRSGGKAELLLLKQEGGVRWHALVRGVSSPGADIVFAEGLTARLDHERAHGEWVVSFSRADVREHLERYGEMPLPPYIKRSERNPADREAYQTVFARTEGSIAAPTAGFHFTPDLLKDLRTRGVETVEIVLHVGWGTFRPVRSEQIQDHVMLPESYEVSVEAAGQLNGARQENRRIIAVGTTVTRTLESIYDRHQGRFRAGSGETNVFIYPGFEFQALDALITNFHLPHSTPLLLACAFYDHTPHPHPPPLKLRGACPPKPQAKEGEGLRVRGEPFSLRAAYVEAVREGYRFYSYGDAMFIQ